MLLNLEDDKSSQLKIAHFLCQAFQLREREHTLMVPSEVKASPVQKWVYRSLTGGVLVDLASLLSTL